MLKQHSVGEFLRPTVLVPTLLVLTTIVLGGCLGLGLFGPTKWDIAFPDSVNCMNKTVDSSPLTGKTITCLFPNPATYAGTIVSRGLGKSLDLCNVPEPGEVEVDVPGFLVCYCFPAGSSALIACSTETSTAAVLTERPAASLTLGFAVDGSATTLENQALVQRFFDEVWREASSDAAHEIISADIVVHDAMTVHEIKGLAEMMQWITNMRDAFSAYSFTYDNPITEGDRVVVHWTLSGMLNANPGNAALRGEPVKLQGVSTFRIIEGKIVESWIESDLTGVISKE